MSRVKSILFVRRRAAVRPASALAGLLLGVLFALGCTLCLAPSLCAQAAPERAPIHLVIFHTNDIHGQVLSRKATWLSKESPPEIGGLPRLAAKLAQLRAAEPQSILVDAGDWYQGTPEGSIDCGLPFVQALAQLRFDAMCIGNHEFDHGVANVERLVREARLPAILANVRVRKAGARLPFAKPWILIERHGVRIALVGLLTTSTPEITSPEVRPFEFATASEEMERVRKEIGDQADLIVPVGHLAVEESKVLAQNDRKLALIVSGHSHTYLKQGVREGECLIVQSGSKASALGRVDLWLDPGTFAPLRSQAQLIDLLDDPKAPASVDASVVAIRAACDVLAKSASAALETVVGELAQPLSRTVEHGCSTPGSWIADALRRRMKSDIGVHNRGGTRCDLEAGPVTRRHLFELLPFDNDAVAMDLSGEQVLSLARRSIEETKHIGLDFSGLTLFVRRQADNTFRLARIEVGGRALDPKATYRVATNSFLSTGGDGAVEFQAGKARVEDPALLREVMEEEFAGHKRVSLPMDAALRFVEEQP